MSKLSQKRDSVNYGIQHCWNIIDNPFSEINAKERALERLIQLRSFKHLVKIVVDVWKPVTIRMKALDALAQNPKGNETFLFMIVNDSYMMYDFRKIALEGLIKAESRNHLFTLMDNVDTPIWVRKRAIEAFKTKQ